MVERVTPCIWFPGTAEDAVRFYVDTIPGSRITATSRYGPGAPLPEGTLMTLDFELQGRPYMAINGGPDFALTPALSLMVACDTQAEIDRLWEVLAEGGTNLQCGWLTDRYGLTWQVVPSVLQELMCGDAQQSARVMQALWGMVKLDIAALERAARGEDCA